MSLELFHPVIQKWFLSRFENPSEPQIQGWPGIAAGQHTLIAAPTGSGKTLTAFLSIIDRLFQQALRGQLKDEIHCVYVSPLRALSNDMHKNLLEPLQEIQKFALEEGYHLPEIRIGLRTGDTSAKDRAALIKKPPPIVVTTPESLYLLLTAERSREKFTTTKTVIVDEIHALVPDKRGAHLSLTLERLEALCPAPLQRIGLSVTQKPISLIADFLRGTDNRNSQLHSVDWSPQEEKHVADPQQKLFDDDNERTTTIKPHPTNSLANDLWPLTSRSTVNQINIGHARELDLSIEVPPSPLSAICSHEQWAEVHTRVVELINSHRSTLIFVNTRRMAERVSHQLTELLGEEAVSSHHGSLAAEIRLDTEQRLKTGQLKAVVATASLELGIDVGYIDLVIQLGSPDGIAKFLQRIGRSGHALGLTPKGALFALTRDELVECMGLIRAVKAGRLDAINCRNAPLDVLAQQLVAEVAAAEWNTDSLYQLFCQAWPYRNLTREGFDEVVQMLSEGITHQSGRSRTYLHHDQIQKRIRPRRNARIVSINNAGSIPDIGSYRVVAEPDNVVVGSLDEDFAVESQAGDVFLLGNTSWRLQHIRGNDVKVVDAQGAPPTVPFWRGESPGRTLELSQEVSRLREEIEERLNQNQSQQQIAEWLHQETCCCESAAAQIAEYVAAQKAALGLVPTHKRIVFERFFDETGGMQLVVHAPFGSRITRAWGFAMRKRFCRSFDFELQATADDDGYILTLGPQHSFPIESLFPMLTSRNAYKLLEQALIYVPTFQLRWRWVLTTSLLVERRNAGKRVPPPLQRFRSDDLLTAVFPKLTGCQEEHTGDHEIPDHPLINQTMEDCFNEALNFPEFVNILDQVERGEITFVAKDTREPSPFCYELLNANPYAFLDGGEVIDRRARAVGTRRSVSVESVSDLSRLDPVAIETVIEEVAPLVRDPDELHDYLLTRILIPVEETTHWQSHLQQLRQHNRVGLVTIEHTEQEDVTKQFYVTAEKLPIVKALWPEAITEDGFTTPAALAANKLATTEARIEILRGWMEYLGPVTSAEIAAQLGWTLSQTDATFEALEGEGIVLRGKFRTSHQQASQECQSSTESTRASGSSPPATHEWCHRRLLARIHRLTIDGLRKQIEPVDVRTFQQFLFRHQGIHPGTRREGVEGLFESICQLQGLDLPSGVWERDLLRYRLKDYSSAWLDELCMTGEVGWGRLYPAAKSKEKKTRTSGSLSRNSLIALFRRDDADWLLPERATMPTDELGGLAQDMLALLQQKGAMFARDLQAVLEILPTQLTETIGELISRGWITADGFGSLRELTRPAKDVSRNTMYRGSMRYRKKTIRPDRQSGRWSLWRRDDIFDSPELMRERVEAWAWQLLHRWGVVFRDLLEKEQGAPRWYELVQCFRRLEARGEIRGGRFIRGVAGEQFANSDTVAELRKQRDRAPSGEELVILTASDPLNLAGVLTDQPRVPALAGNRIIYWKGDAVACYIKKRLKLLKSLTNEESLILAQLLHVPPGDVSEARREFAKVGLSNGASRKPDTPKNIDSQPNSV